MDEKKALRREMAAQRRTLDDGSLVETSRRVVVRLLAMPWYRDARVVMSYIAVRGEVDMGLLHKDCWQVGRRLCVPAYSHEHGAYAPVAFTRNDTTGPGRAGVPEPVAKQWLPMADVEFVVVPGVAFDRTGGRLGRGGGHYDRLLAGRSCRKVGVAFDFQIVAGVPRSAHDEILDAVITESNVFIAG